MRQPITAHLAAASGAAQRNRPHRHIALLRKAIISVSDV